MDLDAAPVRVPRRPKLDGDYLFKADGLELLLKQKYFLGLPGDGFEARNLENFITQVNIWQQAFYPYGMTIADFAKHTESDLAIEKSRKTIAKYRKIYIDTHRESDLRKQRAHANKLKAVARQLEKQQREI
jgi:hypothetical protein